MNVLAKRLKEQHEERGGSLKTLSGGRISQQALSNYERGLVLPAEETLPKIAECYKLDLDEIRTLYAIAKSGPGERPIQEEPFLSLLRTTTPEDHLVTITQDSLLCEKPELIKYLLDLLYSGTHFTYVTYIPSECFDDDNRMWEGNHTRSARIIWQELKNRKKQAKGKISYLILRKPTPNDFVFLRTPNATIYLYKGGKPLNESFVWNEACAPNGEHWWQPMNSKYLYDLHYWLVHKCGLQLPEPKLSFVKPAAKEETRIELKTLKEFLRL